MKRTMLQCDVEYCPEIAEEMEELNGKHYCNRHIAHAQLMASTDSEKVDYLLRQVSYIITSLKSQDDAICRLQERVVAKADKSSEGGHHA